MEMFPLFTRRLPKHAETPTQRILNFTYYDFPLFPGNVNYSKIKGFILIML